jgi:hypothetical protein
MANNWKISVFCAGCAFGISFLFGLIGGVSFGTIILRAFLGALLFGCLGFGAELFLRRLLPELFSGGAETGSIVDITEAEIDPREYSSGEDKTRKAADSGSDDEEQFEGTQALEDSDDLVEEIEELPQSETDTAAAQTEAPPTASAEAAGDYDVLPDVGELDASFSAGGEDVEGGVLARTSGAGAKAGAMTEDQNPALLAKVLQTVIKRDNEG